MLEREVLGCRPGTPAFAASLIVVVVALSPGVARAQTGSSGDDASAGDESGTFDPADVDRPPPPPDEPPPPARTGAAPAEGATTAVAVGEPQPMPTAEERSGDGPGRGGVFQGLLATQGLLDSGTITSAGLRAGYRFGRITLTANFGFNILRLNDEFRDETATTTALVFTFSPTLFVDIWSSSDDKVKFGILGSVGFGYLRLSQEFNVTDGSPTEETISDAAVIPFTVGVYGDYFMHPNFAIGVEGGFKGLPTAGGNTTEEVDGEEVPPDPSDDSVGPPSFNLALLGFYGAIRFTVVIGS